MGSFAKTGWGRVMSTHLRSQLRASVEATGQAALDLAWHQINSLGGSCRTTDRYASGYNRAIDDVLDVLAALGAKDPAMRALDKPAPLSPGALAAYRTTGI